MHYLIKTHADAISGERVEPEAIGRVIAELSGRSGIADYCLAQITGRRRRMVFVAASRGSKGAERFGYGFVVERVQ